MSESDEDRIARLPKWAQAMIHDGETAMTSVEFWRSETDKAKAELDEVRQAHAREHGAEQFDTWTTEDSHEDEEIRFGLGTGTPVYFGDGTDVVEDFRVTYRDHGLDIALETDEIIIKPPKYGNRTLRIEFE
jgi:hypothetical protein